MEESGNWRGTLEMIRRAGTRRGRETSGYYSIEGVRLHERALRAQVPVARAIVTGEFLHDSDARTQALLKELRQRACQIEIVPDEAMEALVEGRDLGHIVGLIRMPPQSKLEEIVADKRKPPLLLVAVDIKDPGNVGALVRTAHAGKATAFVATGVSDPYHPKAVRTSMGSLFRLPLLHRAEALPLIGRLRQMKIEPVGSVAGGGVALPDLAIDGEGVALFIGSEAFGLAGELLAALRTLVTIPMGQDVDSFSVNAAAAILLYEIGRRQKI